MASPFRLRERSRSLLRRARERLSGDYSAVNDQVTAEPDYEYSDDGQQQEPAMARLQKPQGRAPKES